MSRTARALGPVLLALALLVTGCADAPRPRSTVPAARCAGLGFDQVRGPVPPYGARQLSRFTADRSVCAAYWIRQAARGFVPQSLAVRGHRAYVTGYRWNPALGKRPCQIAVIDTRSGRTVAFQPRFQASVYRPAPTFCRHGGGTELTRAGLWVLETARLWLLDPAALGHRDPVLRVWKIGRFARGSALVVDGQRLGVAGYRRTGPAAVHWFRIRDLLAPGVDRLASRTGTAHSAVAVGEDRVPAGLQGITAVRGRLWFSVSNTRCGVLIAPDGRRLAFVPGGEDVQFAGRDLWTVSEAGAAAYVSPGEGLVPMLLRLDRRTTLAQRATCRP